VTSPVTVTGLTNGTNYTFTVWALNSFGPSAYSAASGSVTPSFPYIEDVFSTWLYTGNSSTQTITNGIDLSTKGGLVWTKSRQDSSLYHVLSDSATGPNNILRTNSTAAAFTYTSAGWSVPVFNSNGYTTSDSGYVSQSVTNLNQFVSWTFRKQPKFFDVVTYTGDGTSGRTLAHSLGSVPGCVIIKRTSTTGDWVVWHRSLGGTYPSSREYLRLNLTSAADTASQPFTAAPSSSALTLSASVASNASGSTYVAYLFAHDAGGFGLTGTDNVISCGSYTGNGSTTGPTITLGYEPQWVLIKQATSGGTRWTITDNMRGFPVASSGQQILQPNTTNADIGVMYIQPTSTGFRVVDTDADVNTNGSTYIYIAIRRGPMKTPTTGTSVFTPTLTSATTSTAITVGFPTDSHWANYLSGDGNNTSIIDRLRGMSSVSGTNTPNTWLGTTSNSAESTVAGPAAYFTGANNTGWVQGSYASGASSVRYDFRRAPGFFDVVCYSGSSSNTTQTHNLGVVPEMIIVKSRNNSRGWPVYTSPTGAGNFLFLNSTDESAGASTYWNNTTPTASVFSLGTAANTNNSGENYVAYLFATLAGVSKVGSYTGTGNTLQINCGFTGGARFVLIKRTDVAGAWYVWDSARGIVSGNDPYLLLNSTAAEVTNTDWVDAHSPGFELSNAAGNNVNINGGTFVFLAIA
jgi:hypothetical protein